MPLLDGMDDDTGRQIGNQEKAMADFIRDFSKEHAPTPMARLVYASMLSLARNIDSQMKGKGREISRNMNALRDYIQLLQDMYPPEVKADDDVESVWNGDDHDEA